MLHQAKRQLATCAIAATRLERKARIRELREAEEVVGTAIVKRRSESSSGSEDKSDIWKLGAIKYLFTPSFIAS